MLFGQYDFTCRLTTDAQLPHYKGSTFRGVFGRALKKVVCALKRQECTSCMLNCQCLYARVFEACGQSTVSRMSSAPRPFVIEPPLTARRYFTAGSDFKFSLLLMGNFNKSIAYFIYAFEQMGKIGIGRKINGQRGQFILEHVKSNGKTIYSSTDNQISINDRFSNLDVNVVPMPQSKDSCLKLTLETPLRLKYTNRLQAELPFHLLTRAMLRRISSLMNTYDNGEPSLDYPGLVKKAYNIKTVDNQLSWYDWQRYSFRQDQKMLMGGITGSVTYKGELAEYIPLAEFCEQVHLGKQTTFGLGKIKAQVIL